VAIGNSFVVVGSVVSGSSDEDAVGGGLFVGAGAVARAVDWLADAADSCVAGGGLGVSLCWLHPHSDNPASVNAAAIWILRIKFTFVTPFVAVSRHLSMTRTNGLS
jgi:hypothetical protein